MTLNGSELLVGTFVGMPLVLMGLGLLALWRLVRAGRLSSVAWSGAWLAALGWMLVWGLMGATRALDVWDGFPPRALPALIVLFVCSLWFGVSRTGELLAHHLSFGTLIGLHAFRLPLELMMYQAMLEGLMPPQMSFVGLNYDVATGVLAIAIAVSSAFVAPPRWLIWGFNGVGCTLLGIVLVVAILSLPPVAAFGPQRLNTWVFEFPYIYLPTVMVQVALIGHVLLFRKLALTRAPAGPRVASKLEHAASRRNRTPRSLRAAAPTRDSGGALRPKGRTVEPRSRALPRAGDHQTRPG